MGTTRFLTAFALAAFVTTPAFAQDGQRRRPRDEGQSRQGAQGQQQVAPRERAVERATETPRRAEPSQRAEPQRREDQNRREEQARRDNDSRRQYDARSDNRRYGNAPYDNGNYNNGRYDNRRGYAAPRYAPRIIRPTVIRVAPYRPYVYRPSYRIGVYYGSQGYYPYGVTPRGYYDPLPGRYYGGVRITGVPRDAEVFADGYYVGLVNDFDGLFQHVNLEAGPHHIEIDWGGYEPIAFDVYVRPGETTTFRGDGYFGRY